MSPDAQANLAELKRRIASAVDGMRDALLETSHAIHAEPELAFEEHAAAGRLVEHARKQGLAVSAPAYGLETAFAADFGEGESCVAILAEYDALPDIGHACGHNLIATSALGAALALRTLGAALPGRVRLLGTPAEEKGGGKELMARQGALEAVDAAIMMHPSSANLQTMPCIALSEVDVIYRGRSAHASAMPERGINALDGLVIAYQAVGAMRQHIASGERIHGIIVEGGVAPNIVPDYALGRFYIRAANREALAELKTRVVGCFEAGARASGAELELQWGEADYLELRRNLPLEDRFRRNAEALGREFIPVELLPASVAGSTDMGNVSHRVPSIHPMLQCAPFHCTIHNAEFAIWAASADGDQTAIDGAKALAMTALEFLADADLRSAARSDFDERGPVVFA